MAEAFSDLDHAAAVARGVRRWTLRGWMGAARILAAEAGLLVSARRLAAAAALVAATADEDARRELGDAAAAVRRHLDA